MRRLFHLAPLAFLLLGGCASSPVNARQAGRVMGGNQPVAGATITLYTVGTDTDGGPATPILTTPVTTDSNGYFSLYGLFSCPDPGALTFVTATGGNPGLSATLGAGAVNPNLALVAAIGRCDTAAVLNPIQINEVTTVAATAALGPFMASASAVGASPADMPSLIYAFSNAAEMARMDQGSSPGAYVPTTDIVPWVVINTLADALSTCVNSPGGQPGDSTRCGQLFTLTGVPTLKTPTTVDALLSLFTNPTENTVPIFNLAPATARFQPVLTLPPLDFRILVTHTEAVQLLPLPGLLFSNQALFTASTAQTVTIYNGGTTGVVVTAVSIDGANTSDFAVAGSCLGALAGGASCTVAVSFSPIQKGRRSAYLAVSTTGTPSYPPAAPLSGTGY